MPVELLTHERAADAVMSTYLPELHTGMMRLQRSHSLAGTFQAIFPESQHLNTQFLDDLLSRRLRDPDLVQSSRVSEGLYQASTTRLNYEINPWRIPILVREAISRMPILAVGGGLSNLVKLATLFDISQSGLDLETVDRSGKFGGQWVTDPEGLGVAWNNPPLTLLDANLSDVSQRDNPSMQNFISRLSRRFNRQQPIIGTVVKLAKNQIGRHAILESGKTATPGHTPKLTYLALGNYAMPIESSKMQTNVREFESEILRNQRPLSEIEARKLDNSSVVIVGLGNSALKQVNFIREANEKYHVNITPIILTHFTSNGLWNPDEYHERADGTIDRVSRDLAHGKTTNLELDLDMSNRLYHSLLYSSSLMDPTSQPDDTKISGIVPSVTKYQIERGQNGYDITLTISNRHEQKLSGKHILKNVGAIFVLAGYGVPLAMLENMEIMPGSIGRAKVKPHVGAAYLLDGRVDASLLVGGIASTSELDPSDNTLPGMLGHLPNQIFHSALLALSL